MAYPCLHFTRYHEEFKLEYAISRRPQYSVKMDDPNITLEEYIMLEEEKALRRGKVYNLETAMYGKISYDEDVHYLRSFEKKELPAIANNDTLASDFSHEPTVSPQHIDEFDETSLSECDDEGQNAIYFNDLFLFNVIYPDDLSDKDNDNDKIDMEHSSRDLDGKEIDNVDEVSII
ncbi:hypothetical protein Tco_0344113 [Tanacetum coccineum]